MRGSPGNARRQCRLLAAATVALALTGCFGTSRLAARYCGAPAARAALRANLQTLDCLISLSRGGSGALALRIERGFRNAYRRLLARPLRDAELGLWLELYRLSTRFYPRLTTLPGDDGIPMSFVNAHHFSVPFWIRRSLVVPLGTLLHVDTHSDMDGIPRMDDVRAAVRNIRAGRALRQSWHLLAHAIHRNAMPVTGAVLAAGVRDVVWIKPEWTRDVPEIFGRAFFYARRRGTADRRPLDLLSPWTWTRAFEGQTRDLFQLYYDPGDNQGSHLPEREGASTPWDKVAARQRPRRQHFEGTVPVRLSIVNGKLSGGQAERLVELTGRRFVLDVDLDYFVNVGSGSAGGDNPPSFGQRVLSDRSGDSHLEEFRYRRMKAEGVAEERVMIAQRVERFHDLLRHLRAAGKRPTVVSLADSSAIPFTSREDGEESDVFVPGHHAYWLRERVTAVIRDVFGATTPAAAGQGPHPRLAPRPQNPRRVEAPTHLGRIRQALWRVMVWAVASAHGTGPSPLHLWLLHAVAIHGPTSNLRRAAAAAAALGALDAIEPAGKRPSASASATEVYAALCRLHLAVQTGSAEARVELAGVRWLAHEVGASLEPSLDADTRPFTLVQLRALTGGRSRTGGELAALLIGEQASDGGFGAGTLTTSTRAAYSLLVTRGLLGLVASAATKEPSTGLLWPAYPIRRSDVDGALLRSVLFLVAQSGRSGKNEDVALGLRLLQPFAHAEGDAAFREVVRALGRALVRRWRPPEAQPKSLKDLARRGDLAEAVVLFGGRADKLTRGIQARKGWVEGTSTAQPPGATGSVQAVERRRLGLALRRLGLENRSLAAGHQPAYPGPKAPSEVLYRHVVAVAKLLLEARRASPAALDPARFRSERRFLARALPTVRGSLRPKVIASWVLAQGALGAGQRVASRDLVWQLLHMKNDDGSWGTDTGARARMGTTARAALALARALPTCRKRNLAGACFGPTLPLEPIPRARRK